MAQNALVVVGDESCLPRIVVGNVAVGRSSGEEANLLTGHLTL